MQQAPSVPQAQQVRKVPPDLPARQVRKALLGLSALPALSVRRVQPVRKALPVLMQ